MITPIPENEIERVAALRQCGLLDTDPEEAFDDITVLASQICGVPIAAVSLIDADRQWSKSVVGLERGESSRETAFCAHTILQSGLMVVPDAKLDPRFVDNPSVTGDPHIRFYAGTPLVTSEGYALGALCVVDRAPRALSAEQQAALRVLGRQVVAQIALKQHVAAQERLLAEREAAQVALREFAQQLHTTVEAMQEGLTLQDASGTIQVCNPAAERILGLTADQMMGRTSLDPCWRVVREDGSAFPGEQRPAMCALRTGETQRDVFMGVHRPCGDLVWVSVNASPLFRNGETRPHAVVVTFADVTERKQAEDARARLAAIVDSSSDAIFGTTLDGTLVSWNQGAEALYGYSAAEMIGNSITALAGTDGPSPIPEVIRRLRRGEDVLPMELLRHRKDGSEVNILLSFSPIRNAAGEMVGLAGIGQDVTAQKRMTEVLRRSEARFAEAQRIARVGSWESDLATGRVEWSDEMYRIFGRDRALGPPADADEIMAMYHPDDCPQSRLEVQHALTDGVPFEADRRIVTPNGVKNIHTIEKPIFSPDGRVTGLFGTAADVTERRQAEDALRRAEENYRGIFENAIDGIFQSVPGGRFVRANPSLARMLGYASPEELMASLTEPGRQLYVDAGERERFTTLMREQGLVIGYEVRFRRKDGSTLWASMNARLVRDAAAGCEFFEGTVEDITARRAAEEKVRDYAVVLEFKMRELEAANAELERLATTDGLTGLLNHRAFQERLSQEFRRAGRYGTPLSLLMLDVDAFKQFNDAYGHPAGDVVLRTVADVLRAGARETDIVARYGGEEFVMILPLTDAAGTCVVAERIRAAVEATAWKQRPVTISIGVCTAALHTDSPAALIACADHALYGSKAGGRNRVTYGCDRQPQPVLG